MKGHVSRRSLSMTREKNRADFLIGGLTLSVFNDNKWLLINRITYEKKSDAARNPILRRTLYCTNIRKARFRVYHNNFSPETEYTRFITVKRKVYTSKTARVIII